MASSSSSTSQSSQSSSSADCACVSTDTSDATSGSDAVGCCSSDSVPSLLSRLRSPTQSDIMRKRKIRVNQPPHTGERRKKPACSTDPKNVSVSQRVNEFSSEMLTNSGGKLFCSACREELSLKLSIVKKHVESAKHSRHKHQQVEKRSKESDLPRLFESMNSKFTLLVKLFQNSTSCGE